MASEKPGPGAGPEPQPAGLLAVGAGAAGEPRGAAGPGAVVLPAGMINPSVPIRNIRMKFAVLIGLIQVGEVSNRDIVETVLNLVRKKGVLSVRPSVPRPLRPGSPRRASLERGVQPVLPAGDLPARRPSRAATSLLSPAPLLLPERSAQLDTAFFFLSLPTTPRVVNHSVPCPFWVDLRV